MGILDVPGLSRDAADLLYASRDVAELITGRFPMPAERKLLGPLAAAPDVPTVTVNATPDGTYNKVYAVTTSYPAGWPVDLGEGLVAFSGNYSRSSPIQQVRLWRFQMDGWKMALKTENIAPGDSFLLWVNGAPYSLSLTAFGATNTFTTITFGTDATAAKPRTIEILTTAGLQAVYTHNPYRLWKPPANVGPKVLLMGDSYSAGVTIDSSSPTVTESPRMNGFAATLGLHLGVDRWMTDGIGGTGYARDGGGFGNYQTRTPMWYGVEPDCIIFGGGGANDLAAGAFTVEQTIAAAENTFEDARENLPGAKLVFMEGFAPPVTFGTFNDEYIAIRQALQSSLASVGVYYIDIATSAAWIDGAGYKGATTGSGNSDIYIGGDGIHPTIPGNKYIRERLAPKLRAVLADNGELLNTLI